MYSELPKGKLSFEEVVSDLDFAIPKELIKKVALTKGKKLVVNKRASKISKLKQRKC